MACRIDKKESREPSFIKAQDLLLKKLLSGNLKNGEYLKESVLAKEFGVNRPSMREALCQAIGWGVVEYVSYCGYRVRNFSLGDIRAWSELREGIEPIAARNLAEIRPIITLNTLNEFLAQEKRAISDGDSPSVYSSDLGFHMTLVCQNGNARFASPAFLCYFSVLFRISQAMHFELSYRIWSDIEQKHRGSATAKEKYTKINEESAHDSHREIFDAICSGNAAQAEQLVRKHANTQVRNIRKIIEVYGNSELFLADLIKQQTIAFDSLL